MLHRRQGKQIILNQDSMRVSGVKPPLAMIVGKIINHDDVMGLLAGIAKLPIQHDPSTRTAWLDSGSIIPGNVESLHDHMMSCPEQNHPIGNARRLVDDYVAGLAHGFEMNVSPVACACFSFKHKASVHARHHCDKITA